MELATSPRSPSSITDGTTDSQITGDKAILLANDSVSNGTSPDEGDPLHKSRDTDHVKLKPPESSQVMCIKKGEGLRVLILASVIFSLAITVALIIQIQLGPPQVAPHGAVAADVEVCSQAGVTILSQGGSAVDAAIATLLCNGVINAQSSGIGGGHFMLIHNQKTSETRVIDARETAPAAAQTDMYNGRPGDQTLGARSIAVPGELRGMETAHQLYGKLPWSALFKPAIDIAKNGFPVGREIASVLANHVTLESMKYSAALAEVYAPGGAWIAEGQTIKREDLAATLETIAKVGADAFYKGKIADDIIAEVGAKGGVLTKADLENYSALVKTPLGTNFRGNTVLVPPLPAGGATLLMMLNVMESFNTTQDQFSTPLYYQQLLETFKFSFADFFSLGDPAFNLSLSRRVEAIISKAYAEEIRAKITLNQTFNDAEHYRAMSLGADKIGTTHISVVDSDELFVSVTSSINWWFGSKFMTSGGILMNNHMADFSTIEKDGGGNKFNFIQPGKRPLSAMCPTIVYNTNKCGPRMALGASNGTRILTGIVEVFMNYFEGRMTLSDAIDKPRIHDQLDPTGAWFETSFPKTILDKLSSFGHKMNEASEGLSVVQGVVKVNETLSAYSDPRKFGKADQY